MFSVCLNKCVTESLLPLFVFPGGGYSKVPFSTCSKPLEGVPFLSIKPCMANRHWSENIGDRKVRAGKEDFDVEHPETTESGCCQVLASFNDVGGVCKL